MTLQKEYELVCQIFNDNFKIENDNNEFKEKVFMNPSMWISASHIIGDNNANLAELLFNVREKIDKKKISNFSIFKKYIKNKEDITNGYYKTEDGINFILCNGCLVFCNVPDIESVIPITEPKYGKIDPNNMYKNVIVKFFNDESNKTRLLTSTGLLELLNEVKQRYDLHKTTSHSPSKRYVIEITDGLYLNANYLIDILSLYKETGVNINFGKNFCTFTHPNNISSLVLGVHIQDKGLCI